MEEQDHEIDDEYAVGIAQQLRNQLRLRKNRSREWQHTHIVGKSVTVEREYPR
jgi:hypothetical protein